MSRISVRNLEQSYGEVRVLEKVNLEVKTGEFCTIVGASGCGKSTFLRLLLSEERPTRGEIHLDDALLSEEPCADRGVVFQRYSVFPHLTVMGNLILPLELRQAPLLGRLFGAGRRRAVERAEHLLERVGLDHVRDAHPKTLSGGMQQRLAIAQALMPKPKVLLLDEPFGALDPGTRLRMHDILLGLWEEEKMTVFMVTHDLKEGFKLGTRLLVFDKLRWDPDVPQAYGATVTYDLPLKSHRRPPPVLVAEAEPPEPDLPLSNEGLSNVS